MVADDLLMVVSCGAPATAAVTCCNTFGDADAKIKAMTGFLAKADANAAKADAKTVANTRRTQKRDFSISPPICT